MRALRQGRALTGFFGVSRYSGRQGYSAVISEGKTPILSSLSRRRRIATYWDSILSVRQWSVRPLKINAGQSTYFYIVSFSWLSDVVVYLVFALAAYLAIALVCIIKDAPLISNPNRAGM